MAAALTEIVKGRVDRATKAALRVEMKRTQRTEGAIVRLAVRDWLTRQAKAKI